MALLINNISVNQAQVSEIYTSALNSRKLGEAMCLPTYVIDEVRRQIREEGLRYLKPDTTINKTVPFTINHAKNEARQKVTPPSQPVVTDKTPPAKREKTMQKTETKYTLKEPVLLLLAQSKNLMQNQELNETIKVDKFVLGKCLKDLVSENLVTKTPNSRYFLAEKGVEKIKVEHPNIVIHPNVYKRFEPCPSKQIAKLSKAKHSVPAVTKPDKQVNEMMEHLLTDNNTSELDQIEIELAQLNCGGLNAVDVKVKILNALSDKFGGKVGAHLTELQHYISR